MGSYYLKWCTSKNCCNSTGRKMIINMIDTSWERPSHRTSIFALYTRPAQDPYNPYIWKWLGMHRHRHYLFPMIAQEPCWAWFGGRPERQANTRSALRVYVTHCHKSEMGVSINGGTPKWLVYKCLSWKILVKLMIWRYLYFRTHPQYELLKSLNHFWLPRCGYAIRTSWIIFFRGTGCPRLTAARYLLPLHRSGPENACSSARSGVEFEFWGLKDSKSL